MKTQPTVHILNLKELKAVKGGGVFKLIFDLIPKLSRKPVDPQC